MLILPTRNGYHYLQLTPENGGQKTLPTLASAINKRMAKSSQRYLSKKNKKKILVQIPNMSQ
jgi:hypothetical protein